MLTIYLIASLLPLGRVSSMQQKTFCVYMCDLYGEIWSQMYIILGGVYRCCTTSFVQHAVAFSLPLCM